MDDFSNAPLNSQFTIIHNSELATFP
jgi:hypothetical protein